MIKKLKCIWSPSSKTINQMTGKTLVCILNYNLKDQTDILYRLLKLHEKEDFVLAVIDNGSPQEGRSDNTTHQIQQNGYFGGGLNAAFKLILDNPKYDSLLFLNNDLIVHGHSFVKTLRHWMTITRYKVLSPCILQPEESQLYWKTMQNWGHSTPRTVKWVDFQAPLFHRDVIEEIRQFPQELYLGYGHDIMTGITCKNHKWLIGVCDMVPAIHYNSLTLKTGKAPMTQSTHAEKALANMKAYLEKIGQTSTYRTFRKYAEDYQG